MNKIIFSLLLSLIFVPVAKAEVPQGVMGFMDGKLYNTSTNSLAYICFMDGNCFDKEMKFAFNRGAVAGISTSTPTPIAYTLLTIPNQWFPRAVDDSLIPQSATSIQCSNRNSSNLTELVCSNGSTKQVTVKAVLYNGIGTRFEGDYSSVNDKLILYNTEGNIINFEANSVNTTFYANGTNAKSNFQLFKQIPRHDPSKQVVDGVSIIKSYNIYPYLVLVEVEGKDVVYKVQ